MRAELAQPPSSGEASRSAWFFSSFRLDPRNEQLWRDNQRVSLPPRSFALLCYLARHPQRLITKDELLDALWGDLHVGDAVLKTHVKAIRRALGDAVKAPRFIETVHGRGYRFIAPIQGEPEPLPEPEPVRATARASTFVGREQELAKLELLLERAHAAERQLAFVTGEAGIGKTMLLKTFLAPLEQRDDALVASGQCIEQYGAGAAYLPVLEALGRLSRGPAAARVIEVLRRTAPTWLVQMPELLDPASRTGLERVTAVATPERMLRELAEALPLLTQIRPIILLLEDLHWADYSTLDLLSYLGKRSDLARLLLLGTFRSADIRFSDHPLWAIQQGLELHEQCDEIALDHLTLRDVVAYLDARFAGHHFPEDLARVVHTRTAGNPLFMARVIDSLLKQRLVSHERGHWELRAEINAVTRSVPESVAGMIERELGQLTSFDRSVLEAASVVGAAFSPTLLAAVLDHDLLEVEALCTRWARRGRFIKQVGAEGNPSVPMVLSCDFIHAVYRQVIYERIGATRQMRLHQRIGEAGEAARAAAGSDQAPAPAAELALHFERSRDFTRAVRYRRTAGQEALRKSAYREAIEHFSAALELLPRLTADADRSALEIELYVLIGVPLAMTEGYASPRVEHVYLRAAELCRELGATLQSFPVMSGIAMFYLMRGMYDRSREIGEQFLAVAESQGDVGAKLEASHMLGASYVCIGDYVQAKIHLARVLELYESHLHRAHLFTYQQDPYVPAQGNMAWVLWLTGYPDQALAKVQETLSVAERGGEPFSIATALLYMYFIRQWRRESELALQTADAMHAICSHQGFLFLLAVATEMRGAALASGGEVVAGIDLLRAGWARHQATGAEFAHCYWRIFLAEACIRAGQWQEALDVLLDALQASVAKREAIWEPELYRIYGELCQSAPEPPRTSEPRFAELDSAEAAFTRALSLARAYGARSLELRAATSLARLWTTRRQHRSARSLLSGVYLSFTEGWDTADLVEAGQLLGNLEAILKE